MIKRRAFTLIELLLVIAVLSLLLALLTPTLTSARDKVRAVKCQYNAKSIGAGLGSYECDNRMELIVIADGTQLATDPNKHITAGTYLFRAADYRARFNLPNNGLAWCAILTEGGYFSGSDGFVCPNIGKWLFDPNTGTTRKNTLLLNSLWHWTIGKDGKRQCQEQGPAKIKNRVLNVEVPAGKVQAAETGQWANYTPSASPPAFTGGKYDPSYSAQDVSNNVGTWWELADYWDGVRPRHNQDKYCTTLFVDKHVNLVPIMTEYIDSSSPTFLGPGPWHGRQAGWDYTGTSVLIGF